MRRETSPLEIFVGSSVRRERAAAELRENWAWVRARESVRRRAVVGSLGATEFFAEVREAATSVAKIGVDG